MPTVNETLRDRTLRHQLGLLRRGGGVEREILAILDRADEALVAQLRARLAVEAKRAIGTGGWTTMRLQAILGELRGVMVQGTGMAAASLQSSLDDLVDHEVNFQTRLIKGAAPIGLSLTKPSVEHLVAVAEMPYKGMPFRNWLGTNLPREKYKNLNKALQTALVAQPGDLRAATKAVTAAASVKAGTKAAQIALAKTRSSASAIARSAVNSTAHVARRSLYQANSDIIKAIQWLATLDGRTTMICATRDGKKYSVHGHRPMGHALPWREGPGAIHWQCRSTSVPVLKSWKELGLQGREITPKVRASMKGEVPAKLNYGQWIRGRADAGDTGTVYEFLGKTRGDAFIANPAMTIDKFVDRSGFPMSIGQLQAVDNSILAGDTLFRTANQFQSSSETFLPRISMKDLKVDGEVGKALQLVSAKKDAGMTMKALGQETGVFAPNLALQSKGASKPGKAAQEKLLAWYAKQKPETALGKIKKLNDGGVSWKVLEQQTGIKAANLALQAKGASKPSKAAQQKLAAWLDKQAAQTGTTSAAAPSGGKTIAQVKKEFLDLHPADASVALQNASATTGQTPVSYLFAKEWSKKAGGASTPWTSALSDAMESFKAPSATKLPKPSAAKVVTSLTDKQAKGALSKLTTSQLDDLADEITDVSGVPFKPHHLLDWSDPAGGKILLTANEVEIIKDGLLAKKVKYLKAPKAPLAPAGPTVKQINNWPELDAIVDSATGGDPKGHGIGIVTEMNVKEVRELMKQLKAGGLLPDDIVYELNPSIWMLNEKNFAEKVKSLFLSKPGLPNKIADEMGPLPLSGKQLAGLLDDAKIPPGKHLDLLEWAENADELVKGAPVAGAAPTSVTAAQAKHIVAKLSQSELDELAQELSSGLGVDGNVGADTLGQWAHGGGKLAVKELDELQSQLAYAHYAKKLDDFKPAPTAIPKAPLPKTKQGFVQGGSATPNSSVAAQMKAAGYVDDDIIKALDQFETPAWAAKTKAAKKSWLSKIDTAYPPAGAFSDAFTLSPQQWDWIEDLTTKKVGKVVPLPPVKPKAIATPKIKAAKPKKVPKAVEVDIDADGWKQVGPQTGSNPGGLFEAPDGQKWYVKTPSTKLHVENELLANALYAEAGVSVPKMIPVRFGGKASLASRWEEGLSKIKTGSGPDLKIKPAVLQQAPNDLAIDSWLANWDTVGLEYDNMFLGANGQVFRLDQGGSMLFRAMGGPKGTAFADDVSEWLTLRNPSKGAQSSKVFGAATDEQLVSGLDRLANITEDRIDEMVGTFVTDAKEAKALATKLKKRRKFLLAERAKIVKGKPHLAAPAKPASAPVPSSAKAGEAPTAVKSLSESDIDNLPDPEVKGVADKVAIETGQSMDDVLNALGNSKDEMFAYHAGGEGWDVNGVKDWLKQQAKAGAPVTSVPAGAPPFKVPKSLQGVDIDNLDSLTMKEKLNKVAFETGGGSDLDIMAKAGISQDEIDNFVGFGTLKDPDVELLKIHLKGMQGTGLPTPKTILDGSFDDVNHWLDIAQKKLGLSVDEVASQMNMSAGGGTTSAGGIMPVKTDLGMSKAKAWLKDVKGQIDAQGPTPAGKAVPKSLIGETKDTIGDIEQDELVLLFEKTVDDQGLELDNVLSGMQIDVSDFKAGFVNSEDDLNEMMVYLQDLVDDAPAVKPAPGAVKVQSAVINDMADASKIDGINEGSIKQIVDDLSSETGVTVNDILVDAGLSDAQVFNFTVKDAYSPTMDATVKDFLKDLKTGKKPIPSGGPKTAQAGGKGWMYDVDGNSVKIDDVTQKQAYKKFEEVGVDIGASTTEVALQDQIPGIPLNKFFQGDLNSQQFAEVKAYFHELQEIGAAPLEAPPFSAVVPGSATAPVGGADLVKLKKLLSGQEFLMVGKDKLVSDMFKQGWDIDYEDLMKWAAGDLKFFDDAIEDSLTALLKTGKYTADDVPKVPKALKGMKAKDIDDLTDAVDVSDLVEEVADEWGIDPTFDAMESMGYDLTGADGTGNLFKAKAWLKAQIQDPPASLKAKKTVKGFEFKKGVGHGEVPNKWDSAVNISSSTVESMDNQTLLNTVEKISDSNGGKIDDVLQKLGVDSIEDVLNAPDLLSPFEKDQMQQFVKESLGLIKPAPISPPGTIAFGTVKTAADIESKTVSQLYDALIEVKQEAGFNAGDLAHAIQQIADDPQLVGHGPMKNLIDGVTGPNMMSGHLADATKKFLLQHLDDAKKKAPKPQILKNKGALGGGKLDNIGSLDAITEDTIDLMESDELAAVAKKLSKEGGVEFDEVLVKLGIDPDHKIGANYLITEEESLALWVKESIGATDEFKKVPGTILGKGPIAIAGESNSSILKALQQIKHETGATSAQMADDIFKISGNPNLKLQDLADLIDGKSVPKGATKLKPLSTPKLTASKKFIKQFLQDELDAASGVTKKAAKAPAKQVGGKAVVATADATIEDMIALVDTLKKGGQSMSSIAAEIGVKAANLSRHLKGISKPSKKAMERYSAWFNSKTGGISIGPGGVATSSAPIQIGSKKGFLNEFNHDQNVPTEGPTGKNPSSRGAIMTWMKSKWSRYNQNVRKSINFRIRKAMEVYKDSAYRRINKPLRKEGRLTSEAKALDDGFNLLGAKMPTDMWVHRGIDGDHGALLVKQLESGKLRVGSEIGDAGFSSVSVSEDFAIGWGNGNVLHFRMRKGMRVLPFDSLGTMEREAELLLHRGWKARITSARKKQGTWHIELEFEEYDAKRLRPDLEAALPSKAAPPPPPRRDVIGKELQKISTGSTATHHPQTHTWLNETVAGQFEELQFSQKWMDKNPLTKITLNKPIPGKPNVLGQYDPNIGAIHIPKPTGAAGTSTWWHEYGHHMWTTVNKPASVLKKQGMNVAKTQALVKEVEAEYRHAISKLKKYGKDKGMDPSKSPFEIAKAAGTDAHKSGDLVGVMPAPGAAQNIHEWIAEFMQIYTKSELTTFSTPKAMVAALRAEYPQTLKLIEEIIAGGVYK